MAGSGLEGVLEVVPSDAQAQPSSDVWPNVVTLDPEEFELEGPMHEGVNGVWTLRDKTGKRWIFKPASAEAFRIESGEEILGNQGSMVKYDEFKKFPLKRGVRYGASSQKEVAAYLLDHENFAGVPQTYLARVYLPSSWETLEASDKVVKYVLHTGSLQEYQPHYDSAENIGTSLFSVEQVHKIGVLDVRLLNLDRHSGNILVSEPGHMLHPIDHGFSLPDFRETSDVTFEWLYWKQCKEKFSPRTLSYIQRLDPLADAEMLFRNALGPESALSCLLSTTLLKVAAEKGLTLFQIGSILQRKGCGDEPSVFERLVSATLQTMELDGSWDWEAVFKLDNSGVLSLQDRTNQNTSNNGSNDNSTNSNNADTPSGCEILTLQDRSGSGWGIVCDSSNATNTSATSTTNSATSGGNANVLLFKTVSLSASPPLSVGKSSSEEEKIGFPSLTTISTVPTSSSAVSSSSDLDSSPCAFASACANEIENAAQEDEQEQHEKRLSEINARRQSEGGSDKFAIEKSVANSSSSSNSVSRVRSLSMNEERFLRNENNENRPPLHLGGMRKKSEAGEIITSVIELRKKSEGGSDVSVNTSKLVNNSPKSKFLHSVGVEGEEDREEESDINTSSGVSPAANSTDAKKRERNRKKKERKRTARKNGSINKEPVFGFPAAPLSGNNSTHSNNINNHKNGASEAHGDEVLSKMDSKPSPVSQDTDTISMPALSEEPLPPMFNLAQWTSQPLMRSQSNGSWGSLGAGLPGPLPLGRSRSSGSCDTVNIWKDVSKNLFDKLQAIVAEGEKNSNAHRASEYSQIHSESYPRDSSKPSPRMPSHSISSNTSHHMYRPPQKSGKNNSGRARSSSSGNLSKTSSALASTRATAAAASSASTSTEAKPASACSASLSSMTAVSTTTASASNSLSSPINVASTSSRAWRSSRVAAAAAAKGVATVATALFGDGSSSTKSERQNTTSSSKSLTVNTSNISSNNTDHKLPVVTSPREKEGGQTSDVRHKLTVSSMIGEAISQMKARRASVSSNLPSHEMSLTRSGSHDSAKVTNELRSGPNDGKQVSSALNTHAKVLHPSVIPQPHDSERLSFMASLSSSPISSPSSIQVLSSPSGPRSLPYLDITEQSFISPPSSPPVSMRLSSPPLNPPTSPFSPPSSPPVASPLSSPPSSPFGEKVLQLEANSANQWLQSFLTIFLNLLEVELRPMCNPSADNSTQ